MRSQEHTVMNYLVWAVFFAVALVVIYNIFQTSIKTSVPSPLPQMLDTIRSAVAAGSSGLQGETCTRITLPGEITITKELIKRQTGFDGPVTFTCHVTGNCESKPDSITLTGGEGRFCAKLEGATLKVYWK